SLVKPGETPDARRRRSARLATAIAFPVLVLVVFGGWRWWIGEAEDYRRSLDRPLAVVSTARSDDGAQRFRLEIPDSAWRAHRFTPLLPDQGQMMHLFLVQASPLHASPHSHPATLD